MRDEILNTGLNSQSLQKTLRRTINRDNVRNKTKLKPHAQVIWDLIEKEKETLVDVRSFVLEGKTKDDLKLEIAVRQRNYAYLAKLQKKMLTILKSEPKPELETAE